MEKKINKDTVLILCLLLLVVIANIITNILLCSWISKVDTDNSGPKICVPFVKESVKGDTYRMACYTLEEYKQLYGIDIIQKSTDTI